jgi:hypothetical protein
VTHHRKPSVRKPATKFAHLRKKMDQNKLRGNVKKLTGRKSMGK